MTADAGIDAVAIIGMAGRFPGAGTIDQFWRNIRNGVESIAFFTDEELLAEGCPPEYLAHPTFVKAKGALDGVPLFDASFFGYTPKEAQLMDPQQRLFLECGWHALENAGYDADVYRGLIGVYAGVGFNQYLYSNVVRHPDAVQAFAYDKDFLTTRLSYRMNLKGPSLVVQTACSTSLVAVCQACQSLLSFQCDMALAGGIAVSSPEKSGYFYQEGGILSPDGHCRPFDARAQGTVMGSGIGLVVLKRLDDAIADGDRIRAVIRGFAVNNDGAAKMGYTAPSIDGQAQVIRLAQALGGVAPESIGYMEAHGTATKIGDPIEVAALTQAFRAGTSRAGFCAIGSVKGNVGHLDTAAGIAGLIKAALALEHRELPPSLHFSEPNPEIDFANSPFYVNTKLAPWDTDGAPRRAGVSSFGIGGTNAHVVLEEAPGRDASPASARWQLLTISARTASALDRTASDLAAHLRRSPQANLADLAYTSHVGRKKFPHARTVVCRTIDAAAVALEAGDPRSVGSSVQEADGRPVVFLFPGQGIQYPNMCREIYGTEPVFRQHVDDCCARLRPALGFDLREVLYPGADDLDAATARLHETLTTQCALFAIEHALAKLWISWGITPTALAGHSVGEYVAACLSGVLSLEDALKLVVVRGRLMQSAPAGAMVAVPLGEDRVRDLLRDNIVGGLSIAAVNGPSQCVVAGAVSGIEALEERLRDEAVTYQRLRTAGGFHSSLMSEVAGPLTTAAREMRIGAARIPYVSNVTGEWITASDLRDPAYWGRHVLGTVRFGAGVETLLTWGAAVFLEAGPGQSLGSLVRQVARSRDSWTSAIDVIPSLPSARDTDPDGEYVVRALGRLWLAGIVPDWQAYHANEKRLRVELPAYPFERKRYWADPVDGVSAHVQPSPAASARRADLDAWFAIPSWSRSQPPSLTSAAPGRWLVFLDGSTPGEQLAELLDRRGHTVVRVRAGEGFARASDSEYVIRPAVRGDYDALVSDLGASDGLPDTALHLWLLSGRPLTGRGEDSLAETCQARGFSSLLYLAQAWGDLASAANLRLVVVSDPIHDVTGSDAVCPEKATVLGAVRVMPQEYATVSCRIVDVVAAEAGLQPRAAAQLLAEIESDAAEPVVAYRGIDRWTQAVEPVRLLGSDEKPKLLRDGGTYLITGGYGAMGMEIARHLASAARANVILVGRGGVPARELWQKHVSLHGRDDEVSRKIRALQALEESGAEVLAARADVASETQMREVVADARRRFGRIDGVFHAAGIAGGGVMQLRKADAVAAVMRPKVVGTRVLERVLADDVPDFMLLCSSLNAVTGGAGQADYSAANAYLDAFARYQTARGGPLTVSINWDTWREAGMAAGAQLPKVLAAARDRALESGMTSAEGIEVLRRVLTAGMPQVLVSTGGWARPASPSDHEDVEGDRRDSAAAALGAAALPLNPRPSLSSPYVPPEGEISQRICDVWRDALGVQQVGMDDSFFDLGGHSLLAIQVMARLNADFGTAIPVAKLYEGLTPSFLAELVREGRPVAVGESADGDERQERQKRQKQHQEKRRVARTGQGRLVQ